MSQRASAVMLGACTYKSVKQDRYCTSLWCISPNEGIPTNCVPFLVQLELVVVNFSFGMSALPICIKRECVRAQKGLALLRASHSGEITLAGSLRLLAAAPVLFAHTVVTETKTGRIINLTMCFLLQALVM